MADRQNARPANAVDAVDAVNTMSAAEPAHAAGAANAAARPPRAKRPPQLDTRLAAALSLVRPGSVAADIGCDHGKLTVELLRTGVCPRVIATDLRPAPLNRAKAACQAAGLEQKADFRLGDGLSVLKPGEAQELIIAGMGAETITDMLDAAPWVCDPALRLILIPATKHSLLRRWLCRTGFAISEEKLCVAAGHYYTVICAHYTGWTFEPEGEYCILGLTGGQPGAGEYRARQTEKLKKYRRGLPAGGMQRAVDALIEQLEKEK